MMGKTILKCPRQKMRTLLFLLASSNLVTSIFKKSSLTYTRLNSMYSKNILTLSLETVMTYLSLPRNFIP